MPELPNTIKTVVHFKLGIITTDEDDNKFIDCAFAANADYIVSNDTDFNVLKQTSFPSISVITADAFKTILIERRAM